MKKILLTGSNGMLAYDFQKYFGSQFEIIGHDRQTLDITDIEQINTMVRNIKPEIIVNFAAYTAVDDAEDIGKKLNFDINTLGTYYLAKVAKEHGLDFITLSTDYVFDGNKAEGYNENDERDPVNAYGMSKYLSEKITHTEHHDAIIVRTSWLYGGGTQYKNFVNTMLKLSETRNELKVIDDQFGIPTSAKDLSQALAHLINHIDEYRGQILQFSNASHVPVSWCDFAQEIFKQTEKNTILTPCSSGEYVTKAKRPAYSLMKNHSKIVLRDWKEGLGEYLKNLGKTS